MHNIIRHSKKLKVFLGIFERKYHILGIETSCDDTAAAVVNDAGKIMGEKCFSQTTIHNECGGILPHIAQDLHALHIEEVVESAMKQSQLYFKDLDAVAVTVQPGLILSLEKGIKYAKYLCATYKKPLIPIHHMEAHALTARMIEKVEFPFLSFLISGGHCIITLVNSVNEFRTLGQAHDSTPGQVFDKIARRAKLFNLKKFRGLPGGKCIEMAAENGDPCAIEFNKRVLAKNVNCSLSFSGFFSTSYKYIEFQEKRLGLEPDEVIPDYADLCASLLWAITQHLCQRLEIAIMYEQVNNLMCKNKKCLVISGGVICNNFIREAFKYVCDSYNYELIAPPPKLCSDNGVMIAWNGIEKLKANNHLLSYDELNSIVPLAKCDLGTDISNDVEACLTKIKNRKYTKLEKFIEKYKLEKNSKVEEKIELYVK